MNIVVVRHSSGAGTKRAPLLRKLWTTLALGGNTHPLAQQWMPAECGRRFGITHHSQNTMSQMNIRKEDVLEYHASAPAGKISVTPTKPCATQRDLSLAYTPGVAIPCLEIEKQPNLAHKHTAKGNLVAVVTNGTAVLGLGNIGA